MPQTRPDSLAELIPRLAPGTPFRQGIELVIQQQTGALIILGWNREVSRICTGGFLLRDVDFSPERLAELAKMDGAIVLDIASNQLLRANVHLNPDSALKTTETGTRHRTAERAAAQTGVPVIAISEGRRLATIYSDRYSEELESPTALLPRANEAIHTMERFRRRLDETEEVLDRLEVNDSVTYRTVVSLLQRAELLQRLYRDITRMAVSLGAEGRLIELQAKDAVAGVNDLANLVLADYAAVRGGRTLNLDVFSSLSTEELYDADEAGRALHFNNLDASASARGWRVLSGMPRLPESIRKSLVSRFKSVPRLLRASVEELSAMEGIGKSRAHQIHGYLQNLRKTLATFVDSEDGHS